jgi:hypothetical protein
MPWTTGNFPKKPESKDPGVKEAFNQWFSIVTG